VTSLASSKEDEEEAVKPCTRAYVATNGWPTRACNRLTLGTAGNPCFMKAGPVVHGEASFLHSHTCNPPRLCHSLQAKAHVHVGLRGQHCWRQMPTSMTCCGAR
jgi:hypothetical protein